MIHITAHKGKYGRFTATVTIEQPGSDFSQRCHFSHPTCPYKILAYLTRCVLCFTHPDFINTRFTTWQAMPQQEVKL